MLQNVGASAVAEGAVKDTTTQTFLKDVIEESRRQPVLVDFWAEWCGPCKQLAPVLEKVVRAAKGKVKLVKMDIDKHPSIPGQLGIQSIPAVFAFVNGQPVDGFMGALPEAQVMAFVERLTKDRIGGEEQDLLKAADAALAQGNPGSAAELYAQVLAEDAASVPARAGLARAYLATGAIEQAKQALALVPEAKRNDAAVAAARAALELVEQAKSVGPIGELEAKVKTNPLDYQARFDLATTAPASSWCNCSMPGARPTRRRSRGASGCRRSCSLKNGAVGRMRASDEIASPGHSRASGNPVLLRGAGAHVPQNLTKMTGSPLSRRRPGWQGSSGA
jgi:putative thioredoxin